MTTLPLAWESLEHGRRIKSELSMTLNCVTLKCVFRCYCRYLPPFGAR